MIVEVILHGDEEMLDCTSQLSFLRLTLPYHMMYRWNRDGLVKTIPRSVVSNMLASYEVLGNFVSSGVFPELPDDAGKIDWSQCR